MGLRLRRAAAAALIALCAAAPGALAHGFAGSRFFPATIATDDPFVADELSLPTFTRPPTGTDGSHEYDLEAEIAKRLTPDLGLTLGYGWAHVHAPGEPAVSGFGPLETGVQYQLFVNGPHEAIGLADLNVTWGHTGRVHALEAPDFTTVSPGFNFGKGFGDLPDSLRYLRPFALTGNLGFDIPTKVESAGIPNPHSFNYGFAIEYSLEYLQHQVRDIGLKAPFDRLVPLVELSFSTGLDRGAAGATLGTVQPGIIWAGQYFQIGAEAILPINRTSGRGFGGVVQLHFFLDDLFPKTLGKPILRW